MFMSTIAIKRDLSAVNPKLDKNAVLNIMLRLKLSREIEATQAALVW